MKEGKITAATRVAPQGVQLSWTLDPGDGFGRRRRLGLKDKSRRSSAKPKTAWQLQRAARKASTDDWLEL